MKKTITVKGLSFELTGTGFIQNPDFPSHDPAGEFEDACQEIEFAFNSSPNLAALHEGSVWVNNKTGHRNNDAYAELDQLVKLAKVDLSRYIPSHQVWIDVAAV